MLTLVSRTYRGLAAAVVAVAAVSFGLFAADSWQLGAARGETWLAHPDATIVATLPEVEVVAEPMDW